MSVRRRPAAPGPVEPELAALRAALLVRAHGGFRRAAEALGIDVSLLSRRVVALEDALGVALFQRTPSGARTTGAGERYLAEAAQALERLSAAASNAAREGKGEIGVLQIGHAWPLSGGPFDAILAEFLQTVGAAEIRLRQSPARDLVTAVLERRLDVAILEPHQPRVGALEALPLWSESWVQVSAASALRPADVPRAALCTAYDDADRLSALGACAGPLRVEQTSHDGVMALVAVDEGVAIVPLSVAAATRAAVRFSPVPGATVGMGAVWRADHDNPILRRFIALLRARAARSDGARQATAATCA